VSIVEPIEVVIPFGEASVVEPVTAIIALHESTVITTVHMTPITAFSESRSAISGSRCTFTRHGATMNCRGAATNMGSAARAASTARAASAAGAATATATASHMGHQRHHPITRGLGSRSRGCGLC
jgi:hypothetical protein